MNDYWQAIKYSTVMEAWKQYWQSGLVNITRYRLAIRQFTLIADHLHACTQQGIDFHQYAY